MSRDAVAHLAHLRLQMERRFTLRDLTISLAGLPQPLTITLPADPDEPLDQMAARQAAGIAEPSPAEMADEAEPLAAAIARSTVASGAHLPYWALLWPSGLALAEALLANPEAVRGARTLELGCGLGVTAAVALILGANLTVCDLFDDALLFTEYNTLRCALHSPASLLLNWRTPAGHASLLASVPYDSLLAADILYEREDVAPLLELAPALLREGATFWLAEPGRKVSQAFVAEALARGWHDTPIESERAWPPDGDMKRVVVHRFTLP